MYELYSKFHRQKAVKKEKEKEKKEKTFPSFSMPPFVKAVKFLYFIYIYIFFTFTFCVFCVFTYGIDGASLHWPVVNSLFSFTTSSSILDQSLCHTYPWLTKISGQSQSIKNIYWFIFSLAIRYDRVTIRDISVTVIWRSHQSGYQNLRVYGL